MSILLPYLPTELWEIIYIYKEAFEVKDKYNAVLLDFHTYRPVGTKQILRQFYIDFDYNAHTQGEMWSTDLIRQPTYERELWIQINEDRKTHKWGGSALTLWKLEKAEQAGSIVWDGSLEDWVNVLGFCVVL
tara:strand:- start:139 stop:534 length:396 start_codon:yes stop_codon:yes gene_type:complete